MITGKKINNKTDMTVTNTGEVMDLKEEPNKKMPTTEADYRQNILTEYAMQIWHQNQILIHCTTGIIPKNHQCSIEHLATK
jgi:hypothetical protein